MIKNNENGNSVLITPELFFHHDADAQDTIGQHILVAAVFKGGVVIGSRFDSRLNSKQQWIYPMGNKNLLLWWGDLGDFHQLEHILYAECQQMKRLLGENYVTATYVRKTLRQLLKENSSHANPYAVDFLFITHRSSDQTDLWFTDFRGKLRPLVGFGVLGGYPFFDIEEAAKDQIEKVPTTFKDENQVVEFVKEIMLKSQGGMRSSPLKKALKQLKEIYGQKTFLETKGQALDAARDILFECDPPSKTEEFEFTIFENGKLTSTYLTRKTQKGISVPITDKPLE